MSEIVILGSGIIGLYTGLILSRQGLAPQITYIAKHLPGDQSIEYTSPVAGANFSAGISGDDPAALEFDRVSFLELEQLFRDYGARAGLERLPTSELFGEKMTKAKFDSLKKTIPDLEEITDQEYLKSRGAVFGIRFTTYNFYSPHFIKFLASMLRDQGATFIRRDVKHIRDVFSDTTKVVFNCTGGLAAKLGGVEDKACYPIRGQVVIVRAPHVQENCSLFVPGKPPTYIIPRPHSGGRVVLGGYYQEGSYLPDTLADMTASILDRATRLMPQLLAYGPLEVVDERAGLRPGRKGGARVEKEHIEGKLVIHNYGAAGTGYQSGLGMALKAVGLYQPSYKL